MLHLEIWSDIACPWCYVGKRRMEAALAEFEHRDETSLVWRAYQLDPGAPPERTGDHAEMLAKKYGSTVEGARKRLAEMTEMAAADGLELRFDKVRSANTFDAHRIVQLGAAHGKQDEMKERLMRAYFTEGELVSDHATLARLAADVGLPADEVTALLESEQFGPEVRAEIELAQGFGISGVPCFVLERQMGISGAQSPDLLLQGLHQGWERAQAAA